MTVLLLLFVCANQIQQEKRQQRMLSSEKHKLGSRLVRGGVWRRTPNHSI